MRSCSVYWFTAFCFVKRTSCWGSRTLRLGGRAQDRFKRGEGLGNQEGSELHTGYWQIVTVRGREWVWVTHLTWAWTQPDSRPPGTCSAFASTLPRPPERLRPEVITTFKACCDAEIGAPAGFSLPTVLYTVHLLTFRPPTDRGGGTRRRDAAVAGSCSSAAAVRLPGSAEQWTAAPIIQSAERKWWEARMRRCATKPISRPGLRVRQGYWPMRSQGSDWMWRRW